MNIQDAVFAVVDTETTGLDPTVDRIVEIACVATTIDRVVGMWSTLVNPGIPIPPEVSAVHGLVDADVVGAPDLEVASVALGCFMGSMRVDAIAAHNLEFDESFLRLNMEGVCTKRLAHHLWPQYPAHKNQTLRFRRQLKVETYGIDAHRALGDALVTAALLRDELECDEFFALGIDSIGALIDYAEAPIALPSLPFGKHRHQPIATVPRSYCEWALDNMAGMSRDVRHTLRLRVEGRVA